MIYIQIALEDVGINLDKILYQVSKGNKYLVYKDGEPYVVIVPPELVELLHASSI